MVSFVVDRFVVIFCVVVVVVAMVVAVVMSSSASMDESVARVLVESVSEVLSV